MRHLIGKRKKNANIMDPLTGIEPSSGENASYMLESPVSWLNNEYKLPIASWYTVKKAP